MKVRIREARIAAGYTQAELGRIVGVAQSTLAGYEQGRNDPKFDTLKMIADACDVTIDYLLDYEAKTPPASNKSDADGLSDREWMLVHNFRLLNDEWQRKVLDDLETIASLVFSTKCHVKK